jgi:CRP-like cAMP-binding protein
MSTGMLGKEYKDGEVIVRQGEIGDCMYLIQEGEVEVIQRHGDREFCLSVLGPGDFFGEMALIEKEVRVATVRAVGRACVLSVEKRAFIHRMHEDASFAFRLIKKLSERIRQLETVLVRSTDIAGLEAALFAASGFAARPKAKAAKEGE